MAQQTIAKLAVHIGADLSDFEKSMNEFKKTFGKLGRQLQDAGTKIGTTFTAAGGAVAAGLGVAINKAMDFDSQMSRVGAIAGGTSEDLAAMRQAALDLGATTSKSATEVAVGMELMAAKGYEASEVIAAMPGVIAAAEASGEDMALVADTVASALNAFGMEASDASKVADVLAKSANTSAAGIEDLQYAFKYAAPVANALGISMEQLSAATGIMADNGMKGEQAGTTLRAALLRLTDPPIEAAAQLKNLGVSVTDAQGKFLLFDQIIGQLSTSTSGMANAQKAAALSTIFGTESMSGMLSLVEAGPEKFRQLTTELQNSSGASATAAALMKDNLGGAMQELSGAFETMQISVGSALAPALRTVAEHLSGLVNWFNQLSPQTRSFIAIGTALGAALMVLIGVIGFMVAALGALAAAEWAVILPVAGIIAGTVAIGAALGALIYWIVDAYKTNEDFRDKVNAAWQSVLDFIMPIISTIKEFIMSKFNELRTWWNEIWPSVSQAFQNIWNGIVSFITPLLSEMASNFKIVWEGIKQVLEQVWEAIKGTISGSLKIIQGIVEVFSGVFTGNWKMVWEGISKIVLGTWEVITSVIKSSINIILSMINMMIDKFNSIKFTVPKVSIPFVGDFGGFEVGMPQIPKIPMLNTGTNYVPQDMLAYIHKGEAVVPKEYNNNGVGGGSNTASIYVQLDGKMIARAVGQPLADIIRVRTGLAI